MNYELLTTLLSAGVLTSLVAGIFSLITSLSNNKKIKQLESFRQQFYFDQKRYDTLINEYRKMVSLPSVVNDIRVDSTMNKEQLKEAATNAILAFGERQDLIEKSMNTVLVYFDEDLRKPLKVLLDSSLKARDEYIDQLKIEQVTHIIGDEGVGKLSKEFCNKVINLESKYEKAFQEQIDRFHKKGSN